MPPYEVAISEEVEQQIDQCLKLWGVEPNLDFEVSYKMVKQAETFLQQR